ITPVVNILLIGANVLMFFWEVSLGPHLERALFNVAFIPARFWYAPIHPLNITSMFVSMFLHGGWLHLGGNMLYLWIFGDNIEDRLGHFRYLIFYLLCGIVATLAHAFFNPASRMPSIGASGAIAGVLGAYLLLFPRAQVTTLIPIFFFITVREIPAVVVLGLWFVLQLFVGVAEDPEVEHVPAQMQPSCVKEHGEEHADDVHRMKWGVPETRRNEADLEEHALQSRS